MAIPERHKSPIEGHMTYWEAAEALGLRPNTVRARYAAYGLHPVSFALHAGVRIALFAAADVERVRQERAGVA